MSTFVDAVLSGDAVPCDVDDWIDAWHVRPSDAPLHDWLGLTPDEYAEFVVNPSTLSMFIERRRESS